MKKKLSILLALALVAVSLFTVTAMAVDGEENAPVAQIGYDTYTTLEEALGAAEESELESVTIQVLQSYEITESISIPKGKTFIITADANAQITITDTGRYGIKADGSLTMENITFSTNGQIALNGTTDEGPFGREIIFRNATLNMDGKMYQFNSDGYYCCAIFADSPALFVFDGCDVEIKNYPSSGAALRWNGKNNDRGYGVEFINKTTFISDGNSAGFIGTLDMLIDDSTVKVINSRGYGSNGTFYTISNNSNVLFDNNTDWGISANELKMTTGSTLTATNNGRSGVWARAINVDSTCTLTVEYNGYNFASDMSGFESSGSFGSGTGATSNAGITYWGKSAVPSTIEAGANVSIRYNAGSGISALQGICDLTMNAGVIANNGLGNTEGNNPAVYGGGIFSIGTISLGTDVVLYNNHASKAGDDIYFAPVNNTKSLTFGQTGTNWYLDGDTDCYHRIDGWYDDSNGSRWEAHAESEENNHVEQFTNFDDKTGLATITGLKALKAAHGVLDEDADKVSISPADITIYMGADGGYESVIPGEGGNAQENNGLPEPGYYITLPDWVNALLDGETDTSGAVDLSPILTFNYDVGEESRVWKLERYHKEGDSEAYNKYVYRLVPGENQVNVRLEFKGEDGNITTSESFAPAPGTLHQEYDMTIYAGALQRDQVNASIKIGDNSHEFDVIVEPGKLTIRGVTGEEDTVSLDGGVSTESGFAASVPEDTTYTINGSDIGLNDQRGVQLLVDELVQHEDDDITQQIFDAMTDKALEAISAELGNVNTDFAYMNLVDTNNGNVYVMANKPVTVTWPYPAGTDSNDTFYIVHFTDMNRGIDLTEGAIASAAVQSLETENTENGIRFTVNSFSPFVLVWSDEGGGWNPPDIDDDKPEKPGGLNTEDHVAYIIGYPDGEVKPEGNITRAEVATIFFRLLTDETRDEYWSKTNSYTDVPADSWLNNAISTLSNMGIIDGYADGSFRPDAPITRAEFTKIAVSFFEYADYVYENTFTDVRSGSWYTQFIAAAVEIGLIEGYPDGTFRPDNYITRAEACTIVNRTLNRAPDEDHLLPESVMITWPDNQPGTWYYADMQEATNSHDYDWLGSIEDWTEKLEERDWEALEKLWSDSHDAPGGEVMG